jgi:hypothetical protein
MISNTDYLVAVDANPVSVLLEDVVELDGRLVVESEMIEHDVTTGAEESLYLVVRCLAQLECDRHVVELNVGLEVNQSLLLVFSYVGHKHDLIIIVSEQTIEVHFVIV